jgi:hypothetical protein
MHPESMTAILEVRVIEGMTPTSGSPGDLTTAIDLPEALVRGYTTA